MKKGILLTLVFAGWFLANNQSNREVLLNKHLSISKKNGQLVYSLKVRVWHISATGFRKTPVAIPVFPVSALKEKKYCLRTIVHLPELKETMESTRNSIIYPLAPMLIHSL
jgi:hypothetical protein